ncbi:MAG: hypothetical protein HY298_05685 [Verrucomicrobia bacterium]|nr:hypothetical protein [Verrucomicrobiota bacterium]
MNADRGGNQLTWVAYIVAALGTLFIVAGLVGVMIHYTRPAPLNTARIAERHETLKKLRAEEAKTLTEYDWQDQVKGVVRLPITNAMELIVREYQNPAAARSNLIARVEKATAAPPKAPEKPSPFE